MLGRDWGQKKWTTEDGMKLMASLTNEHKSEWTCESGDGTGTRSGCRARPWVTKSHNDWELNELNWTFQYLVKIFQYNPGLHIFSGKTWRPGNFTELSNGILDGGRPFSVCGFKMLPTQVSSCIYIITWSFLVTELTAWTRWWLTFLGVMREGIKGKYCVGGSGEQGCFPEGRGEGAGEEEGTSPSRSVYSNCLYLHTIWKMHPWALF